MKKYSVTYVKLHTTVFVPALGELEDALPGKRKTIDGIKMEEHEKGILVTCTKVPAGFVIPDATIKVYTRGAEIESEAKAPAAPAKKS